MLKTVVQFITELYVVVDFFFLETWKVILQLCYENQSMYILRESQNFVVELLDRLGDKDLELAGNIMQHVFRPLLTSHQENTMELACNILERSLTSASSAVAQVIHKQNLESSVWMLLVSLDGDEKNETQTGFVSCVYK